MKRPTCLIYISFAEKEELYPTFDVYVSSHWNPKGSVDLVMTGNDKDVATRESVRKALLEHADYMIEDVTELVRI